MRRQANISVLESESSMLAEKALRVLGKPMAQGACHHGSTGDANQRAYPTGERGITRRGAPRPFGAALQVLAKPVTPPPCHLGTTHDASPSEYLTGVIPLLCGRPTRVDSRRATARFEIILAERERGIRTLEGLLTRLRGLRNQHITDFLKDAGPLPSPESPNAASRAGSTTCVHTASPHYVFERSKVP